MIQNILQNKIIRQNITDLKDKYPDKFGIFIVALKNLEDSDDWYRISGIHGNTFKPNDPDVLCPTDPKIVTLIAGTGEPFYCAHSVEPFISWHVPYIHEFELLLNKYNTSVNKDYITLPYFDITQDSYDYSFMNEPEITVLFDGQNITIRNSLASAYYYVNGIKTPIQRNGYLNPTTQIEINKINTIRRQLYNTLHAKTYEEFSSNIVSFTRTNYAKKYTPLETPHNSIHDILGGDGGNMSDISISAFDPIFWLHHCNMDRFFYNWLFNATDKFKNTLNYLQISNTSLESKLAPFYNDNVYSDNYQNYNYGWTNNTLTFISLKDILNFEKFPYTYDSIKLPYLVSSSLDIIATIDLIDIPIPRESMTINAYLYPNNINITDSLKNNYFAGSVSWFGINRSTMYCQRCSVTRTNLKIDILDYIIQNNINKDNIKNYNFFIEGNGKIIKINNHYLIYSQQEIIIDGFIQIILS